MQITVKLPRVAETTNEVVVLEWKVAVGDTVVEGQILMTAETDKAIVEVPAPMGGVIVELLVEVDEEIPTGHPIVLLEGN